MEATRNENEAFPSTPPAPGFRDPGASRAAGRSQSRDGAQMEAKRNENEAFPSTPLALGFRDPGAQGAAILEGSRDPDVKAARHSCCDK